MMDFSHAPSNLIERIFDLPHELKRLVLSYIWPDTLRLHYYEAARYRGPSDEQPVRLTSPVTASAVSQESVFWLSELMINKSWHKAATEHLNNTTIWNLGDIEHLNFYLYRRCESRPARQEAFLQRLRSVQHTSVTVRPRSAIHVKDNWRVIHLLPSFNEFIEGRLPISTVRLHLDDLFDLPSDQQEVWAITMTKFARLLVDNERAIRRTMQVRVACTHNELGSRKGQGFMNMIRQHCGPDTVRWHPTGYCRYQGRLGDLVVVTKGGSFRLQDVRLFLLMNHLQPLVDNGDEHLDLYGPSFD
jgi:hypothetical protein